MVWLERYARQLTNEFRGHEYPAPSPIPGFESDQNVKFGSGNKSQQLNMITKCLYTYWCRHHCVVQCNQSWGIVGGCTRRSSGLFVGRHERNQRASLPGKSSLTDRSFANLLEYVSVRAESSK